jgi:hypothetical protein
MTNVRLKLPDDVHDAVKGVQYARAVKDGTKTNLNEILIDLIRNAKPVSKVVRGILERAARKGEVV